MRHLSLDDRLSAVGVATFAQLHQFQCADDRRERIAQLVPEHGQELVFGSAGGFELGEQPSALVVRPVESTACGDARLGDVHAPAQLQQVLAVCGVEWQRGRKAEHDEPGRDGLRRL